MALRASLFEPSVISKRTLIRRVTLPSLIQADDGRSPSVLPGDLASRRIAGFLGVEGHRRIIRPRWKSGYGRDHRGGRPVRGAIPAGSGCGATSGTLITAAFEPVTPPPGLEVRELAEEPVVRPHFPALADLRQGLGRRHVPLQHQVGQDAGAGPAHTHHAVDQHLAW